jgi:hypothetical protein
MQCQTAADFVAQYVNNHHQITKLSHSINAIGPAPHRGGRKTEHRSIVFASITHIPSLHKICMSSWQQAQYGAA